MALKFIPIYTTLNGTVIGVSPGKKSTHDFRVRYRAVGKRLRTPKHIHIIIDLYMKLNGNEKLTMVLVDHIISVIGQLRPVKSYPPKLQIFHPRAIKKFASLNKYGEYSVDFLLVVSELIQIQEKTNYPKGNLNLSLFTQFRQKSEIYNVVGTATF